MNYAGHELVLSNVFSRSVTRKTVLYVYYNSKACFCLVAPAMVWFKKRIQTTLFTLTGFFVIYSVILVYSVCGDQFDIILNPR